MRLDRPFSVITPTVDGDVLATLARTEQFLSTGDVHRRAARWSVNGVRNALTRLSGEGLVLVDRSRAVPLYALNREHLAAEAVLQLAHLRQTLVRRLCRELERWADQPVYAGLLVTEDSAGALDLLLVRPGGTSIWPSDVAHLRRAVTAWTGSEVRVHDLSERELGDGLATQLPLLVEVRRAGETLAGDELLLWRRPGGQAPVTGQ